MPAFSLYNYAALEIRYDRASMEYCPKGFVAYGRLFGEEKGGELGEGVGEGV